MQITRDGYRMENSNVWIVGKCCCSKDREKLRPDERVSVYGRLSDSKFVHTYNSMESKRVESN